MTFRPYARILTAVVALTAPAAHGAIVADFVKVADVSINATDYNVWEMRVTTDASWAAADLTIVLSQGSMYQDPNGTDYLPPSAGTVSSFPDAAHDTYVRTFDPGVAAFPASTPIFTADTFDAAWFDPPPLNSGAGTHVIAQITLSDDAVGVVSGVVTEAGNNEDRFDGTVGNPQRFSIVNGGFNDSTPIPLVGDYDGSGDVGQGDLDLVLAFWGAAANDGQAPAGAATWVNADDVTASIIGQDELARVLQNWGNTSAITAELGAITDATGLSDDDVRALIPEPATAAVVMLGGLAMLRRR